MNAETRYIRHIEQAEREILADEEAAQEIMAALFAGESIRYGSQRHQIITAEDVKSEFSTDVFAAVEQSLAENGDFVEAGRMFAVEHTRAVVAVAKRNASLRAEYLRRLDAEESAADRKSLEV